MFWFLGYPDRALKTSQKALILAEQQSHAYSRSLALDFAAWLSLYRDEPKEAQKHAEALSQLSVEQEFLFWLPDVQIIKGWALTKQGCIDEGIEQMVQGLAAYETTGAAIETSLHHTLLAEAYKENSQAEKGLEELDKAFAIVKNHRVPIDEAELYRLKGELLLQSEVTNHQLLTPKRRRKPKRTF